MKDSNIVRRVKRHNPGIKDRQVIQLTDGHERYQFLAVSSNKEECNDVVNRAKLYYNGKQTKEEILGEIGFNIPMVYVADPVENFTETFVDRFIPKVKLNSKDAKGVYGEYLYDISKSSKCYCGIADYKECFTDHSKGCIVIHETSISSFN